MTQQLKGRWDAAAFFEKLTATNRLAIAEGFTFCRVSGLEGFEEAVAQMQTANAFVCISDINDGYTETLITTQPHGFQGVLPPFAPAANVKVLCKSIVTEIGAVKKNLYLCEV